MRPTSFGRNEPGRRWTGPGNSTRDTGPVPSIDLLDESFLVADPARVAAEFGDPARWPAWWPGLRLTVFMDRGAAGFRWTVTGDVVGSTEIWLEPFGDGVIMHYFLRADPTRPGSDTEPLSGSPWRVRRGARRAARRQAAAFKRHSWALKDALERGRAPGMPRAPGPVTCPGDGWRTAEEGA